MFPAAGVDGRLGFGRRADGREARLWRLRVLTVGRTSCLYLVATLAALFAGGCQDSEPTRSSAAEIGPEGGTLSVAGATLRIPAGALQYQLRVELVKLGSKSVVAPITTRLAGPAFALRPHGTELEKPATLTLPYRAASDEFVYVARLENEQDQRWDFLPGDGAFADDREATFAIDGFSVYVIVKTGLAVDFGTGGFGGTGGTSGTGAGGAAGETGEYTDKRFCERTCAARAELDCSADRSEEICTSECIADTPEQSDDCYDEVLAYQMCLWDNVATAYECGNDNHSRVKNEVCTDERMTILMDCQGL